MVVLLSAGQACGEAGPAAPSAELLLGKSEGGQSLSILSSEKTPAMARATALWKEFLSDRKVKALVAEGAPAPQGPVMVFETLANAPVAAQAGVDLGKLKDARDEAHLIVAREWNGRPLVLVVGKTDRGAEAGAWQLLSRVVYRGRNPDAKGVYHEMEIAIPPFEEFRAPLVPTREVFLDPPESYYPDEVPDSSWIRQKVNYENWSEKQLTDYVRYFRACGFNSIQVFEAQWRTWPGKRKSVAPVLHTLARAAHQNGMTVTLYIWTIDYFVGWEDPKQQEETKKRYVDLAKEYGADVDHIDTHWFDPGPGGYAVPQEATIFLWREFQKYNPAVKVTIDTWNNKTFWEGDKRMKTLLDETFSPKEVGIALPGYGHSEARCDPAQVDAVAKSGRRLGIWGWYLCDEEMAFGTTLHKLQTIPTQLRGLLTTAGKGLDWISVERSWHALPSDINLYVAGQELWAPQRSLDEHVLSYCRAVYGPDLAEKVATVYQAHSKADIIYKRKDFPKLKDEALAALKTLQSMKRQAPEDYPPGTWRIQKGYRAWKTNFPTADTPEGYLETLEAGLREIVAGALLQTQPPPEDKE